MATTQVEIPLEVGTAPVFKILGAISFCHLLNDLLASLLDDDFVITFEDGNVFGKTGYISFSAASTNHVDVADMTDVKVRMHGNTAILTGVYHEKS